MGTTKLEVFNEALLILGQQKLTATTDAVAARYALDDAYAIGLNYCLEQGMWNFAMRTSSLTQAGAGSFGFTYYFSKPSDFVRLFQAANNASFDPQFEYDFADQAAKLHANVSPIYINYLSNDATSGGGNLTLWTSSFARYVAYTLAAHAGFRITGSHDLATRAEAASDRALEVALAVDSLQAPPGLLPFNAPARSLINNDDRQIQDSRVYGAPGKLPFGRPRPVPQQGNNQ